MCHRVVVHVWVVSESLRLIGMHRLGRVGGVGAGLQRGLAQLSSVRGLVDERLRGADGRGRSGLGGGCSVG